MELQKPKTQREKINEWLKKYTPDCVKERRAENESKVGLMED